MPERVRPYLFYDVALSICSTCLRKVEGKIVFQDDCVFLMKRCPDQGGEKVLIADDVEVNQSPFSALQLIQGLFAGLLIGALCLGLDFFLGLILSNTHYMFLGSVMIAALLITLALAFIVCTICGVALGLGPLRFGP